MNILKSMCVKNESRNSLDDLQKALAKKNKNYAKNVKLLLFRK